jgi:hypothetical protein
VEHGARLHAEDVADRVAAMVDDPPACPPVAINFGDLFLSQEEDDEESASLADALAAIAAVEWPQQKGVPIKAGPFQAAQLARVINDQSEYRLDAEKECGVVLREFLFAKTPQTQNVSPKAVAKAIRRHVGEPVKKGDETLILKAGQDSVSKTAFYYVQVTK